MITGVIEQWVVENQVEVLGVGVWYGHGDFEEQAGATVITTVEA